MHMHCATIVPPHGNVTRDGGCTTATAHHPTPNAEGNMAYGIIVGRAEKEQ